MNTTIIDNLETLLAAVRAQPASQFGLSQYQADHPCGTLFCTVGLATTLPRFQQMGYAMAAIKLRYSEGYMYFVEVNGNEVTETNETDEAFGEKSFAILFRPAGNGEYDSWLGYDWGNMTDKELAIARLEKRIATLKEEA